MSTFSQDDSGQWWLIQHRGTRQRARMSSCPTCSKEFPNYPSGTIKYCSRECWRTTCARCGKVFEPGGPRSKYCSLTCQRGTNVCEECGQTFVPNRNTTRRFCSLGCFYDNAVPVGTVRLDDGGYSIVKVPRGTPGARLSGHRGHWMREHRHEVQKQLGRVLHASETVHHINGDRSDNRIENLQLRSGNHGQGSVRQCADCGSRNIVSVPL